MIHFPLYKFRIAYRGGEGGRVEANLKASVMILDYKVATLETRMEKMEARLNKVKAKLENIDGKLDRILQDVPKKK
jgi:prefoldin subunit 5